jgi:hypothetical protein
MKAAGILSASLPAERHEVLSDIHDSKKLPLKKSYAADQAVPFLEALTNVSNAVHAMPTNRSKQIKTKYTIHPIQITHFLLASYSPS